MPIRAGNLDRRVVIQVNTPAQDAAGELVASWATLATVWAHVEPIAGSERFTAEQVHAEATYRITIRYRSDVGPTNRITYGGDTYVIESALEVGRQEALELSCTVKTDG
jgi:SPP1 family predicted phage head-tail adaptor